MLNDCGAIALVSSETMAEVVDNLDLGAIRVRVSASGSIRGFENYDDVLCSESAEPLDGEVEGREMLYSGGTTGFPKGVRKPCDWAPF